MSDLQRTLTYVAIAIGAAVLAWEPWRPTRPTSEQVEDEKTLFPKFTNPLAAKSLEIIKYDEDTSKLDRFKVAQVNGIWTIPSHQNYPADAKEHMAKAATSVIDLEPLGVVSDRPGDQELYGVIDPDLKTLTAGTVGVGMRVTLRDGKDEVLADLIIGKEVKDQPNLRYVRRAGTDRINRVAVKTDSLSTRFGDWIEKDLLKLNTFDVREVQLNDYSSDAALTQRGIEVDKTPRSQIKLAYDDQKSKWDLTDLVEFDERRKPHATALNEDEELNSEKLNALKSALNDLKIVEIEKKPKGLSGDLRATKEFVKDEEGIGSLINRGFYPVPASQDHIEIYSSEGEVVCGLKDGVEYILRFGNATGGGGKDEGKTKEGDKKDDDKKDGSSGPQMNRFLFVMAQLNKELIPKPELTALPGEEKADEKNADDATDEPVEKKTADKEDAAKSKPAGKAADKSKTDKSGRAKPNAATLPDKSPKATPEKASKPKDEKTVEEKTSTEKPAAAKPTTKTGDDEADAEEKARAEEEKRAIIDKQNKRKQTEYDEKVTKAEERVKELNDRFADWYYVIPDDVYRKIHLTRGDIIKKKDASEKPANPIGGELPDLDLNN